MNNFVLYLKEKGINLYNYQLEYTELFFKFLKDKHSQVLILKGHSKSGKTFISTLLYQYLLENTTKTSFFYPTGRIVRKRNYEYKQKLFGTIHSKIYEWKDKIQLGETIYPIIVPMKTNTDENYIYFIDNASMISDTASEDRIVFGTGRLLADLLDYTNFKKLNNKIVFIGDDKMLEPTKMNFSPAIDRKYIEEKYAISAQEYIFNNTQENNYNEIFEEANKIYKMIEQKNYNTLYITDNGKNISLYDNDTIIEKMLELKKSYRFSQEVMIVSTNLEAINYNRKVKEKMGKNPHKLEVDDKLVLSKTAYIDDYTIYSGEYIYVHNLSEKEIIIPEKIGDKTYVIVLRGAVIEHFASANPTLLNVYIYEHLLENEEDDLMLEEYIAVNKYIEKYGDKDKRIASALKVKYGYAITCNKAQDGSWDNVFIDAETYHNKMTKEYFKWIYTSLTRSNVNAFVINAPNIKLGLDLNQKDEENIVDYHAMGNKLIDMIKNNIDVLKEYNIDLSNIAQNLYTLKFTKNNNTVVVNIYYKKDFQISTIIVNNKDEESLIIKDALSVIKNKMIGKKFNERPRLNNEVLDNIIENIVEQLEQENLNVEIKLLQYKIRLIISDKMETVILDLMYNKNNVITDRKFNMGNNINLINKVKQILGIYNG